MNALFTKKKKFNSTCCIYFVNRSKRDTSVAEVEVKFPGNGSISINGQGIDYFETISCREQVSYKILYY